MRMVTIWWNNILNLTAGYALDYIWGINIEIKSIQRYHEECTVIASRADLFFY